MSQLQINWRAMRLWIGAQQALWFILSLAVLSRLLPHPENITPLAAMGLFAGAHISSRIYLWVPVLAALLSDLLGPGLYNLAVMLLVYLGLATASLLGKLLLRNQTLWPRLPLAVIAASLSFYGISNLGAWWAYYPHSLEGLISCYVNGLPYLGRTLLGDGFYALLFFGSYALYQQLQTRLHYVRS
ncbi:MAG: DUF6580 family putative transport protein [Pseudohongiellaceae bacterium]